MEARHRSVGPDTGRNSGGRQKKKKKKCGCGIGYVAATLEKPGSDPHPDQIFKFEIYMRERSENEVRCVVKLPSLVLPSSLYWTISPSFCSFPYSGVC